MTLAFCSARGLLRSSIPVDFYDGAMFSGSSLASARLIPTAYVGIVKQDLKAAHHSLSRGRACREVSGPVTLMAITIIIEKCLKANRFST